MNYCVIKEKDTNLVYMSLENSSDIETMTENAVNVGLDLSKVDVVVLSKNEYENLKKLEPKPVPQPSETERIEALEKALLELVLGGM